MPGSIKNGGIWRSATGLYIKVGGTWRTVTSAYVKVGGTWKQWFASKIQDAFNRSSTAAGLGTADSGQAWEATSGNWRINGSNQAQSDDSASNYPLVSANLGNTDVKVQADVSGGVGPAFWVSSAGSWWAAVPRYTTYTTSSTSTVCDQSPNSCYSSGCNPGGCCSGISESSSSTCNGGQVQCANSSCSEYPGRCATFSSTSGGGQTCNGGCGSNTTGCPAGNCACSSSTSGGGQTCTGGKTDAYQTSNCASLGGACGSGPFSETATGSYCGGTSNCFGGDYVAALTAPGCGLPGDNGGYVCPSGQVYGSWNGQNYGCYTYSSGGTTYQVNDGGTCSSLGSGYTQVSCSNCTGMGPCGTGGFVCCRSSGTAGYTYVGPATYQANWCKSSETITFTYTNYYCYTSYVGTPSTTTYNYCMSYTQNPVVTTYYAYTSYTTSITRTCYTSSRSVTTNTTNYKTELVLLSSVSGTVVSSAASTISDNTSGFTTVGSVYVQTGGNAISAYAYSASNLGGSQLGPTLTHTASNPTKGTSVGIIKSPSSGSQGSTADNFLATI